MLIKHILFQLFLLEEMWPAETKTYIFYFGKKAAGNTEPHTFAFNTAWELKPGTWNWHPLMVCSKKQRRALTESSALSSCRKPRHPHRSPGRGAWGGCVCWGSPGEGLLSQGSLSCCTVSRFKNIETNSLEFSLWGGKQIMLTTCKHLYYSMVYFHVFPKNWF